MPYAAFLTSVRERGAYAPQEVEDITTAVVSALGRRLDAGAAEHLAEQLPQPLAELLEQSPARTHDWGVEDFCAHVAETLGTGRPAAEQHARAVLSTLAEQVGGGELDTVLSRLPAGYAALFGHPELSG